MRIPLIVASKLTGTFPRVPLSAGRWTFECDSSATILIECPAVTEELEAGSIIVLLERAIVQATIVSPDPSRPTSVYACLLP